MAACPRWLLPLALLAASCCLAAAGGVYQPGGGGADRPHKDGGAPSSEYDCGCTRHYDPVCASNHKTYSNKCVFECAETYYGNKGTDCGSLLWAVRQRARRPGCTQAALQLSHNSAVHHLRHSMARGSCWLLPLALLVASCCLADIDLKPLCGCERIIRPVCGSNHITYDNMCEFQCYKDNFADKGITLTLLHEGECTEHQ